MTKRFSFTYYDDTDSSPEFPSETQINASYEFDDNSTWDVVLDQFVKFLGHCWGYDISDKVSYESMDDKLQRILKAAEERELGDKDFDYQPPEGYTLK